MKNKMKTNIIKSVILFLFLIISLIIFILFKTFSVVINDMYGTYNLWDGVTVSSSFDGGDGTVENPYQINSGSTLIYLKSLLEGDDYLNYNSLNYVLTSNINLDNHPIITIGDSTHTFEGLINGNGYSLANLKFSGKYIDNAYYFGLFAYLKDANVKNINLKNVEYEVDNLSEYNELYLGSISSIIDNTAIRNCGIYTANINIEGKVGGLVGYQTNNSVINNCYVNASFESVQGDYVGGIVGYSDTTDVISNTIFYGNTNKLYGTSNSVSSYQNLYFYTYNNSYATIYSHTNINNPLNMNLNYLANFLSTNINDEFIWKVDSEYLRFDNESNINLYVNSSLYISSNFKEHNTGISNNIVYINDMKSDWDYYIGLNYTSNDGYLPTLENKNLYGSNNLIHIQMTYYGYDYNRNYHGYVSLDELQDTFVYYKTYEVNSNNTSNKNDDYVLIELIDNPFTNRPYGMGFNGWVTNHPNAEISFNNDTYVRYVKVPVKYINNKPEDITINMHASWVAASYDNIYAATGWSTVFRTLKDVGMVELEERYEYVYAPYDMSGYFRRVTLGRWDSLYGYYNDRGQMQYSGTCWSSSCTYYEMIDDEDYNEGETYYYLRNNRMTALDPNSINRELLEIRPIFTIEGSMSGFYERVTLSNSQSLVGYYNNTGVLQTSGTCYGNCTYYKLIQFYDSNGNVNTYDSNKQYYYLVTRDTNILVMTGGVSSAWASAQSKPFTLTSIYNGVDYTSSATWNVSGTAVNCYADTVIENIKINSGQTKTTGETNPPSGNSSRNFYGRWFNVKLGRGIMQSSTNYTNFNHILAGYASSLNSTTHYKFIVESGVYNTISLAGGATSSYTQYIEMDAIYGNDFDRATSNNSDLDVTFCASGQWGSNIYASSSIGIGFDLTVKSGSFGTNKYNYSAGIYVGGRYNGSTNMARKVRFIGGYAYNLIGGPLTSSSRANYNDTYIYVTGGSIDTIIGGAGTSATYGNRIIQVTGGTINYSVFGGSNGYQGTGDDGTLNGSSYIYIGGEAVIGNPDYVNNGNTMYGAEAGSVFGIGNGRSGSSYVAIGSNDNSNIIIDGNAVINNNVYGGGNYGATGISSSYNRTSTNINILDGTIKGSVYGGGNNNGSGSSSIEADVNLLMSGGKVLGSIYGGSNQLGTIYGDVEVTILNGEVEGSVYGGGKGGYANNNSTGTFVSKNVNVVIGNRNLDAVPTISGNVYGGSAYGVVNGLSINAGASSYNTTVTMNKGNVTSIYGGGQGNSSYTPYVKGNIFVNINGGTITDVYGANDANGTPTKDVVVNLYGGNITNAYGGGRQANTTSSTISLDGSIVTSIYGGGNEAGVNDTTIELINGSADNIYGGSNQSGTVLTSVINSSNSDSEIEIKNIYGGNNRGGQTTNSSITLSNISVDKIYGGGNNANMNSNTNITLNNVTVNDELYGGGNYGSVPGNVNLSIDNSNLNVIYGGGNNGIVNGNVIFNINNTTIVDTLYAGGNAGNVQGNTNLNAVNVSAGGSIYGGGNSASVLGDTHVIIAGTSNIGKSVFGGGNAGAIGIEANDSSKTTVDILGGTINKNIYGGCNTSVVYGSTEVNVGLSTSNLTKSPILIKGTIFGGGEANDEGSEIYDYTFISVTNGILLNINGADYGNNLKINGSIFGSGNASSSSGSSYVYISNLGNRNNPNRAISIQRANMVSISNSCIELVGTTDRTNEYSSMKYSVNRVDLLKIKNNTTLLLQQNANLLKKLYSLVDVGGNELKASVTINNGVVNKNTDNRIYIIANKSLNVTTNEAATSYGEITGMTFLGMYSSYSAGSYIYGIYNMENGESADASDVIIGGSYILGLHAYDMNYRVDGFYTNYIDDAYTHVSTDYIEPTPPNSNYYIWSIGLDAINYSFNLTSSKYASLGTYELSLIDFAAGNTTFEVLGFNAEGLTSGVNLVDSNNVPKIAPTPEEANRVIGLSMKSETTEWTSSNVTKFLSNNSGTYTGNNTYLTDNQPKAPSLTFYLYHAKNITLEGNLGTVIVTLQAMVPRNEIEYDVSLIVITIEIDSRIYSDEDAYDASITYGKKYEMPSITNVNITSNSQFTAYYSLYALANSLSAIYGNNNNYYHTLSSNYVLPVGTKITMLDLGADSDNPYYYYYEVNQSDYNAKLTQFNNDGEATYDLSDFVYMNSTSSNNKYNDSEMNLKYFHSQARIVVEEFIFIFDFKDTNVSGNKLNNSIILELRTPEDRTSISVLGIRQNIMKYSLYNMSNVVLRSDLTIGDSKIYYNSLKNMPYSIVVDYDQTNNRDSIIDTNYENSNMGINVTILDSVGTSMSSSVLVGTSILMDGNTYYASSDGVFRIKLSNKVSNLTKSMGIIVGKALTSGNYTLKIELFASSDGLHVGKTVDSTDNVDFTLVGSNNSIDVRVDDKSKIINGETGLNLNDEEYIDYTLNYESVLADPNLRVVLYKRNNSSYDSNQYDIVDLRSLTSTSLVYPSTYSLTSGTDYEYMVSNNPQAVSNLRVRLKSELISGTYKFVFKLYDENVLIDYDEEYIIIKKSIIE